MSSPSNRSKSAPTLQRFSQYKAEPRYSIQGKRKTIAINENIPAANKYDVRELVQKTSKYANFTRPCSFSMASRWGSNKHDNVTGGPGQYNTANSTIKKRDISFGKSKRPDITSQLGSTESKSFPGPGQYEVRGKNCKSEPTFDPRTPKVAGRHGWFYDNLEASRKPGPGAYILSHTQTELPVGTETKIGTSLRPTIESHLGVNSKAPTVGPGHYKHLTTLGGAKITPFNVPPSYSFTNASHRMKSGKPKDDPEMILQATQFPGAGATF